MGKTLSNGNSANGINEAGARGRHWLSQQVAVSTVMASAIRPG